MRNWRHDEAAFSPICALTRAAAPAIRKQRNSRPAGDDPCGRRANGDCNRKRRRIMRKAVMAAIVLAASTGSALAQDVAAGEQSFKKCLPCHSVGAGAKNKVGPELNGLDGRKSGIAEGFNYSEANKSAGITWGEATFKDYIKDPRGKVPGTKMVFAGIKNEQEVNDLWAYLKQFGPNGEKK
jgi:cytochrome c